MAKWFGTQLTFPTPECACPIFTTAGNLGVISWNKKNENYLIIMDI